MILHFLSKCKWQTQIKNEQICSTFQHLKKCLIPIRSYRTKSISTDSSFKISYLENTCGLSGKTLVRVSNLVNFESTEKPNSVLKLFQSFGFSKTHVSIIIGRCPPLLLYDAENALKPKLDFLLAISNSESEIIKVVAGESSILSRSLNNHLIPLFNVLITLMGSHQNAVAAIKRCPSILLCGISNLVSNAELLLSLGASHSQCVKMLTQHRNALGRSSDKFRNVVFKVKEMGFDPSSASFRQAVVAMIAVRNSTWESKFEIYRRFGFSNDEILSMFKKQPDCMNMSMDKIRRTVEFYLTKLHWSPSKLSVTPGVLIYSLERRIIPRCSVLQTLVSRNRISNSVMLTSILAMAERKFLKKYVTEHKDKVPEVLYYYKGELRFDEYNFHLVGKKQDAAL